MKILVTGSAGFIGSALTIKLLEKGNEVVGVDNLNNYYDPELKKLRLARHINHKNYSHFQINIQDRDSMHNLFNSKKFDCVVNLAAQAGVRHSIQKPQTYIDSNLVGFANILEGCRFHAIKHLVYASSSSVYGLNTKQPFSTNSNVDHPVSLYAATKKANELMAHSYSSLYKLPTTGLRFFTVYGPYDRPDMALQKFAKAILDKQAIKIFNYGKHKRDFTYIDDIVEGIIRVLNKPAQINPNWNSDNPDPASSSTPYRIYNIGNNRPIELMNYIEALEFHLGKKANKELLPMQPGDVHETFADIDDLIQEFDYKPRTNIEVGIKKFVDWYVEYYNKKTN
tara:strand:+ start:130 stop:1146 length:1017 start_codon:yes stop_codon:yes gene_type:complete